MHPIPTSITDVGLVSRRRFRAERGKSAAFAVAALASSVGIVACGNHTNIGTGQSALEPPNLFDSVPGNSSGTGGSEDSGSGLGGAPPVGGGGTDASIVGGGSSGAGGLPADSGSAGANQAGTSAAEAGGALGSGGMASGGSGSAGTDAGGAGGGPASFEPCAGLACGDACNACAPGTTCIIGPGFCHPDGSCLPIDPACEGEPECPEGCPVPAICELCDDGSCAQAEVACNTDGSCGDVSFVCDEPEPYDPCLDKSDGEACTLCDPADPSCVETAVPKRCRMGECVPGGDESCAEQGESCGGGTCCNGLICCPGAPFTEPRCSFFCPGTN